VDNPSSSSRFYFCCIYAI